MYKIPHNCITCFKGVHQSTSLGPRSVIGVTQDASPQDIKKAYRRLALRFHPDKADFSLRGVSCIQIYTSVYQIM